MLKLIVLSVIIILTQYSCDYILEKNNNDKYEIPSTAQTRINIYKREAKLLLKASKNSLDILELCETLRKIDTQNSVSHLTNKLEKTHCEILENYDALAEDELISIPTYIKKEGRVKSITGLNNEAYIESNLKLILNKTETQIRLLDDLGNVTDNVNFKLLVIKDTHKLKLNIDKIEMTLNSLNQRTQALNTRKLLL